jgi:hypothetical protein
LNSHRFKITKSTDLILFFAAPRAPKIARLKMSVLNCVVKITNSSTSFVKVPASVVDTMLSSSVPLVLGICSKDRGDMIDCVVAWNGESSNAQTRADARLVIEMANELAASLGLVDDTIVKVVLVAASDVPVVTRVVMEPVSSDDWELLELYASALEEKLLTQTQILNLNASSLPVWVQPSICLRVRVLEHEARNNALGLPFKQLPPGVAVRLTNETQCSVVPKQRARDLEARRGVVVTRELRIFSFGLAHESGSSACFDALASSSIFDDICVALGVVGVSSVLCKVTSSKSDARRAMLGDSLPTDGDEESTAQPRDSDRIAYVSLRRSSERVDAPLRLLVHSTVRNDVDAELWQCVRVDTVRDCDVSGDDDFDVSLLLPVSSSATNGDDIARWRRWLRSSVDSLPLECVRLPLCDGAFVCLESPREVAVVRVIPRSLSRTAGDVLPPVVPLRHMSLRSMLLPSARVSVRRSPEFSALSLQRSCFPACCRAVSFDTLAVDELWKNSLISKVSVLVDVDVARAMAAVVTTPPFIVLSGALGSGRSAISRALLCHFAVDSGRLGCFVSVVACAALVGAAERNVRRVLQRAFVDAAFHRPSILLLDDIDALLPRIVEGAASNNGAERMVSFLNELRLLTFTRGAPPLLLAFTSREADSMHAALVSPPFVPPCLQTIPNMTVAQRATLMRQHCLLLSMWHAYNGLR